MNAIPVAFQMRTATVTALGAAAARAKLLADQKTGKRNIKWER